MIKKAHSAVLVPNPDKGTSVIAGLWLTITQPVWLRDKSVASQTKQWAERLIKAYELKHDDPIPAAVLADERIPRSVTSAMECLLTKSQWEPTILPFTDGPAAGFYLEEKSYSRLILLALFPGERSGEDRLGIPQEAFAEKGTPKTDESLDTHSAIFSPYLFKTVRGRPGSPIEIARVMKDRLDTRKRVPASGTVGKAVWHRDKHSVFKAEYAGRASQIEEGEVISRDLLVNPADCISRFEWLGRNRSVCMVLPDLEKVYPRIDISYEDFPFDARQHDREFFDQPW